MVYLLEDPLNIDAEALMPLLAEQRRTRLLAMKSDKSRRLSLAAYMLLMHGLRGEHGIMEPPLFDFLPGGKPQLRHNPEIHFNMSHCPRCAACALSAGPIGIDVENVRPFRAELARRVLADDEWNEVVKSEDMALSFTHMWTMKESLVKLSGLGLRTSIPMILKREQPLPHFFTIEGPGYVLTICTPSAERPEIVLVRDLERPR